MRGADRCGRETGQASPLYVFMVASLLFLALAFFAVGQAGATRNGAQSAADAAALAAAKESRDRLVLGGLDIPGWSDLFDGDLVGEDGCGASHAYAARNGATVEGCYALADGRWGFTVTVRSRKPVGDTILPGTEGEHAVVTATAVVVPRCAFEPADDEDSPSPGSLDCEDSVLDLDPKDLPDVADLFEVRLAED
ncbi:pilus assembly protein TadG-related protein [Streptomyces sp. TRM76323]|uniref:Pilus assembly protein TadG-related protein n=1 Tax=Streptomyces tamarix TaxID=3078565 RepID=A0ABU3QPN9_9ACTN|nr:pilus assembly protein TadG-related protein [Streptomyces tamarix]MDT9684713.1 pilus assembly protein TadG-related protein [Streptomyces tamarix]